MKCKVVRKVVLATFVAFLINCSSSSNVSIGGSVTGLTGTLVLQNNDDDDLSLTEDGEFTFSKKIEKNSDYAVTVLTQPAGQLCTVSNGTGTASDDVDTVDVTCSAVEDTFSIGGTVTGLTGTVILQNNSADDLAISSDGSFVFETGVADGAGYDVTVLTQPAGQFCVITNGMDVATANVTDIAVTCSVSKFFFVTTTTSAGNLGGIAGADVICNADASKPNGSTYKAYLVDATNRIACTTANCTGGLSEHTDWVLAPNTTYVRGNGNAVIIGTTDANGLFVAPLDANYTSGLGVNIWTGLQTNWRTDSETCSNWTDNTIGENGSFAITSTKGAGALRAGSQTCDLTMTNLACVEQ